MQSRPSDSFPSRIRRLRRKRIQLIPPSPDFIRAHPGLNVQNILVAVDGNLTTLPLDASEKFIPSGLQETGIPATTDLEYQTPYPRTLLQNSSITVIIPHPNTLGVKQISRQGHNFIKLSALPLSVQSALPKLSKRFLKLLVLWIRRIADCLDFTTLQWLWEWKLWMRN